MNKATIAWGAPFLALFVLVGSAAAKVVRYEIDGQTYSYESTRPKEVAAARKLIDAANAHDKANAAAAAERASNPLAVILGSDVQRAAAAARAELDKVIAEEPQARTAARSDEAAEPARPQRGTARTGPDTKRQRTESTAATTRPAADTTAGAEEAKEPTRTPKSDVKSVFVDQETGIKTTFLADGSVREELVGSAETTGSTVPRAAPAPR